MKRAMVIGASGILRGHLVDVLLQKGYEVFAIKHKNSMADRSGVKIIEGGISAINSGLINELHPDVIFHCARPVISRFKRIGRYLAAKLASYYNQKLMGQLQQSEYQPLLVFASGSLMYGNSPEPHLETAPLQPISYARQYVKGELPLLHALEKNQYPIQLMRFPWLLGNGSWFLWFYIKIILKEKSIPFYGDGMNHMQILDVRDAAELMYRYAIEIATPGIYNISSPTVVTHKEFSSKVAGAFQLPVLDYTLLFQRKIEKEALEAFTSNILLDTQHRHVLDDYAFISLERSLRDIKQAAS